MRHLLFFFLPRNLYYDSAPPQLVVSPGAGSYTRHIQDQQRRQQQHGGHHQGGLRLARGTGRQPQPRRPNRPKRNEEAARTDGDDPLGDRRVTHPINRVRQEGGEYERSVRETDRISGALSQLMLFFRAPMAGSDPRLRYYGRLRDMFRSNAYEEAGMRPPLPTTTTLAEEEDEEQHHAHDEGGAGAGGGEDRGAEEEPFVDGARADARNPFDSFLVSTGSMMAPLCHVVKKTQIFLEA